MSARDAILNRVRHSLGAQGQDTGRQTAAEQHVAARQRHPIPDRVAGKDATALKQVFREQLEAVSATVIDVADAADIASAIADYLRGTNRPLALRVGDDADLAAIDWQAEPTMEISFGAARPDDAVGLSRAVAGVAETGTLMLASGPDNPVTLNFMPETHIVVLNAEDIVEAYEDGFDVLRERFGSNEMPRTVNLISGPSRTGDIGGRLVMGAHGPRQFCVIVVNAKD
ncbi:MAG: LUD domain-containing protein [Pseudomonadota bacterium]